MTVRVSINLSRLDAAPGDIVELPVRLTNSADSPATCRVTVVGLGSEVDAVGVAAAAGVPPSGAPAVVVVPPRSTVEVSTPVVVPSTLGIGEHAAAVEISSDRVGDRPTLTPFVVSIGSVSRVELVAVPSTIRGRRRATFKLDVVNHEAARVDLHVSAEAPDVVVQFAQPELRLEPGERVLNKAVVKGPRQWSGEPTQHNIVVTARGRSGATSITTAAYVQRPVFAHRTRVVVAAVTVVALWLGAIGGVALWWSNRQDDGLDASAEVIGRDTDGDGVVDTFLLPDGSVVTGIDTDGDGVADTFTDADGNPVPDPTAAGGDGSGSDGTGTDESADGQDGDSGSNAPNSTVVRGTVKADGDLSDITITLAPIELGAAAADAPAAEPQGFAGPDRPAASKFWSARYVPPASATLNPIRQTEPLAPIVTNPEADGVFQIPDVPLRRSYTVVVAKPGFVTQSFVVTPPDDGTPLDLDVELETANGSISGTVRGPGGALGGAEITISDGTLTFTTTAATVGDIGTWSIDQVSTPGVYTVSAALRGYGTEVSQVTLTPKEPTGIADLTMHSGVGSVSGRILGPDGQPIGGASITATDGDVTRTTSSLTEGDIGSYTIPQLTQSTSFTLLVEAPGYISQSRRTPVNGAIAGVNFTLSKTTIQLTGTVTSKGTATGVANAGLTLKTGDLEFRASTAGGANRGQFAIDDLPPGDYTITVQHYQHVTSTQAITLTAGVAPPPLNIELDTTAGPPALGTGSLVVEVVDPAAKDANGREIKNATVRLIRTRTGEQVASLTQEPYNFRLDDIAIGTYTVLVSAPKYNAAAPRQVSIGQSEERIEVQLTRLGQASGFVIDALTRTKLKNYFINVYRQPENPGDAPIFTLSADATTGLWQTPPDSLPPGTYRVDINDAASPPGYVVRNDQLLDATVVGVGAERDMKFVVPEGVTDPITIADIQADPFPNITGRVYRPITALNTVGYKDIDSPDLAVTMTCPGGTFNAVMSDDAGVQGATPPLLDSFTITKEQVDANNLTGDCSFAISASGFATANIPVLGVDASNGVTSSDRRFHVVLAPPAPAIGGTVFWKDGNTAVPINDATISSTRPVTFNTIEDPALSTTPSAISSPATSTSNLDGAGNGNWQLDGQVAGVAPYLFSAPNFANGTISVKVDDVGTATAVDGVDARLDDRGDGRFHVELSAPTPRTLSGTVTITTNNPSPDFTAVHLTATSPTGAALGAGPDVDEDPADAVRIVRGTPTGNVLPFTIVNAQPGTWTVGVNLPPHHQYLTATASEFVLPGDASVPVPGFDMALLELGALDVTLVDANGTAITATPTVTLDGAPPPTPPAVTANLFRYNDIAVNASGAPRAYTLSVQLAGYDMSRATVTGDTATTTGASAIAVAFTPGSTTAVTLQLPKLGAFHGSVTGNVGAGTENIPLTVANLIVTPVTIDGTPLPASDPAWASRTISVSGNTYAISAAQGYYRIEISHPEFSGGLVPYTGATVPTDNLVPVVTTPPVPPAASAAPGVFRIVNDHDNTPVSPFVLPIIRGNLDLSVFESLTPIPPAVTLTPVTNATYALFQIGGTTPFLTGPITGGAIVVTDVLPGTYRLEIRAFAALDPTRQDAFPVITNITIGRAVASVPSTTVVRAPLPPLNPTVSGTIIGRNSAGRPVALPTAGVTYAVSAVYTKPTVEINGAPVANTASPNSDATTDPSTAATGVVGYTFTDVPAGAHEVTLADGTATALTARGYTLTGVRNRPLVVTASGVVPGPVYQFTVPDVRLTIQLTAGAYPDISPITLTSPSGSVYSGGTLNDTTDQITFNAVAPEVGDFHLQFSDALHRPLVPATDPAGTTVQVPPDTDGNATFVATDNVTTVALLGRLTGTSTQRNTPGSTIPLASGATINLVGTSAGADCITPVPACRIIVGAGGRPNYTFDVVDGDYRIETTLTGFTTDLKNVTVNAGLITTQNVQIVKYATITVTVTNPQIGTVVQLLGSPAVSSTNNGSVYVFTVVPDQNYQVRATAPGYVTVDLPTDLPQIGAALVRSVTFVVGRTITVNVTSPDGPDGNNAPDPAPAGTTVIARYVPNDFTDDTAPFAFSSATAPLLPTAGSGILIVDAPGYRAGKFPIPDLQNPVLDVTIYPLATVTGTITHQDGVTAIPTGTNLVTATSPGMAPLSGNITSAGGVSSYTINGLDVGTDVANNPASRIWNIDYNVPGVGIGHTTVTVASDSVSPNPTPLIVQAQTVPVTFRVDAAAPNGPVTINFNGSSVTVTPTVAGATSAAINAPETIKDMPFTVSGDGYLVHADGTVSSTARNPIEVPVTVVKREPIVGTVATAAGVAVEGATVRVCPDSADGAACTTGTTADATSAATTGAFTLSTLVNPGEYELWASRPGGGGLGGPTSGHVHLTVNANRTYTLSSSTITVS